MTKLEKLIDLHYTQTIGIKINEVIENRKSPKWFSDSERRAIDNLIDNIIFTSKSIKQFNLRCENLAYQASDFHYYIYLNHLSREIMFKIYLSDSFYRSEYNYDKIFRYIALKEICV